MNNNLMHVRKQVEYAYIHKKYAYRDALVSKFWTIVMSKTLD